MALSVGIVGLPNVGKSSTFNALTKAQNAQSANYPFCTIEPNRAIVEVPDSRLEQIAKLIHPQKILYSQIEFVDIAGLVKGASKGEGLGNQFLGNIKEVDAILHLVRCFEDSNITHVEGSVDPLRDIEIINLELILADLATLEKRIEKLTRQAKNDKEAKIMLDLSMQLKSHLEEGKNIRSFKNKDTEAFDTLNRELRFLSNKEIIFGANVSEEELGSTNSHVEALKKYAKQEGCEVITLCAKLEEEMVDMEDSEKKEFLHSLGCEHSGLEQIIRASFYKLGLISYFTAGEKEVRSWTIQKGVPAPKAAGVIHNDFEKGFIRAEVIAYEDFIQYGGEAKAKEAGVLRIEGKDYIVQDGDVMHFRFNV